MATAYDLNQQALTNRGGHTFNGIPVPGGAGMSQGAMSQGAPPLTQPSQFSAQQLNQQALANRSGSFNGIPVPGGGGYSQRQSMPYTPYRLPQGFRYSSPWGQSLARPEQFSMNNQQAPQQNNQAFNLLQMLGLGNFYSPHQIGQAQNVPNSGPMANFIGSYLPNSTVGGISAGGYQPRQM